MQTSTCASYRVPDLRVCPSDTFHLAVEPKEVCFTWRGWKTNWVAPDWLPLSLVLNVISRLASIIFGFSMSSPDWLPFFFWFLNVDSCHLAEGLYGVVRPYDDVKPVRDIPMNAKVKTKKGQAIWSSVICSAVVPWSSWSGLVEFES